MTEQLYNADCLAVMPWIPDHSVDLVLCDLPYGTTKNKWDSVIPFDRLWPEYERVVKENGAICLFADGMFMAELMRSNPKMWRYNLVWDKVLPSGFLNANRMPLRTSEEIVVFYKNQPKYHPQKTLGKPNHSKGSSVGSSSGAANQNYGDYTVVDNSRSQGSMKHPTSILRLWTRVPSVLRFRKPHPSKAVHPTQKPVDLCEWVIRTFTDPGDTVLDNCAGSFPTGIACVNTDRNFIGIEKDPDIFERGRARYYEAKEAKENV